MELYKWKIDRHPNEELGWIIYEWKNAKLTSWNSGNFSSEELAQTRLNKRKAMLGRKNNQEPIRKLTKEEVSALFGNQLFNGHKKLKVKGKKK
ncbi:Uncharacterised protein [[Actinobacillus] rossii]|uniref:Uncharacterized protein n=1 Tax=[Actinobacillus] rossii TaxID=123820 RepID=A0A380U0Z8_9PAST|nr:Uncharacterised protein [[Actinobacillus] rossii]